ncbi:MAG: extracellular solute-binding protein [Nocardioides sp.]|nr:extracellular solute-binding protein [Nocardioides sp.]
MSLSPSGRSRLARTVALCASVALLAAACTLTDGDSDAGPENGSAPTGPPSPTAEPLTLRLGVHGPEGLLAAYEEMAATYEEANPGVRVELVTAPDHDAAMGAIERDRAAGEAPDVFLVEHGDLPKLLDDEWVQPVDELLSQRGVDFGDGYQREGMTAFSADMRLHCMPHDVSPMVVYYNTDLLDLTTIGDDPEEAPTAEDGWTFDQFAEAARSVSTRRVKGVHVAPDLEQLAPFVWSAGGDLVDSTGDPSRLTLSEGDSREALDRVLTLLRETRVTPSREQLSRRSAVDRFVGGRLAMVLGYRSLVPQLREAEDLAFDVMPLPRLGSYRTISSITGFCLSATTEQVEAAADLLTYIVGPGEEIVTRAGYTLPANLDVAYSRDFSQRSQEPQSAFVFNEGIRRAAHVPLGREWRAAAAGAVPQLTRLLFSPVIDLDRVLQRIDDSSEVVFVTEDEADADDIGADEDAEDIDE